jgi:hypothetical protein
MAEDFKNIPTSKPPLDAFTPEDEVHELPTARKNTWLYVYGALGLIVIICFIFIGLYRQWPKQSAPVTKRKIPATKNVFTMVLSPVKAATADSIVRVISADIGADSSVTQMIIGGTAVHKRCTSLDDFNRLSLRALKEAQPEELKRQAVLLSYVAGVITADTLPTKLYIVGSVDEADYDQVEKRVAGAASAIGGWNRAFGNIRIITYIPPAKTPQGERVRSAFHAALRGQAPVVEERAMPAW